MMRWMTSFVVAVFAVGSAAAADLPGQPYKSGKAHRHPYGSQVYVEEEPEVLFTPSDGAVPYIPPRITTPLLPGSATLPGYYGSTHSYDYQGPYYGGPNLGYWYRLPYACGVYGYC
jgi:hypothetical protein